MDAEFITSFVDVTLNVLGTMARVEAKPGRPAVKDGNRLIGDVTGIIGLAGQKVSGYFGLSFSERCIKRVVSAMLGEVVNDLDQDVSDAVGELTNMITGGVKAQLDQKGYSFQMAIPTVITGKGHVLNHLTDQPVILIPFETETGPFFVEICLREVSRDEKD